MIKGENRVSKFKTLLNLFFLIVGALLLILLFLFKGSMNTLISKKMKEQAGETIQKSMSMYVDSAYNYQNNNEGYKITFLEFGATGCISCRRMEKVMDEVKTRYPSEIKVRFVNILLPPNRDMMNYFGIAAIPTQVLLDVSGKEVFRHTGYLPAAELEKEFVKINGFKLVP